MAPKMMFALLIIVALAAVECVHVTKQSSITFLKEKIPDEFKLTTLPTLPFKGQKPGTSGLRKKVKVVQEGLYLHNFIQSIFDSCPEDELKGSTLVVSGDGRYYNKEAILIAVNIAFANGVERVWIGKGGLMSTPAASAVIREREGGVAYGGVILTASHNPGGPENDFGVKFNIANGGPAPESLTDKIYEATTKISRVKTLGITKIDLETLGIQQFGQHKVEIIDPIEDWMKLMRSIFDFPKIRALISRPDFKMRFDGMNGVAGIYARALLCGELGAPEESLRRCESKEDFGGCHPDPNLTYASELVELMKVFKPEEAMSAPDFGAAGDGDNDRNMILGRGFFVTPSDSVAIIANYAQECIPYFKDGLKGLSRSLPTSAALDLVGKRFALPVYEVPTGWKYFGNLMDAGKLSICGEESFGTGSDHIREKDGLWAVLAWLSILAYRNPDPSVKLVGVDAIVREFWLQYGRNYYSRYDYEGVDTAAANKVMERVASLMGDLDQIGDKCPNIKEKLVKLPLKMADSFTYTDKVDGSVAKNQGLRFVFEDGSRIVWRLSGTGSSGATIRVYVDKYVEDSSQHDEPVQDVLKDLIGISLEISQLEKLTGRQKPTVIT